MLDPHQHLLCQNASPFEQCVFDEFSQAFLYFGGILIVELSCRVSPISKLCFSLEIILNDPGKLSRAIGSRKSIIYTVYRG